MDLEGGGGSNNICNCSDFSVSSRIMTDHGLKVVN